MSLIEQDDEVAVLKRRVAKLERINEALMDHVERSTNRQGSAYSLFQTAITLDGRVRARTEELTGLMRSLERSNQALVAAKEDAETANRSKTRFLAAASHDLLQPLNAARLSISLITDMKLDAETRQVIGQVERGLNTIEDLIKTLLDISKLDAGVVRPIVRPVDLSDLLAEIETGFGAAASAKGLRFAVKSGDIAVESDLVLLHRILQNLVSNAVRYTRRGGVMIRARPRGGVCVIDVIDTGPGIGVGEQARIFEEFYRGDGSAGDPAIGLGLGLSIVKRMTLALGHGLHVTSKIGRGSRFRLRIALSRDQTPHAARVVAPMDAIVTTLTGARIAVLENDDAALAALARLLTSWEAEVAAARDLQTLEHRIEDEDAPVALAIVDYHLDNGACGLDAVAWLRETQDGGVPAIVTTADHSLDVAERVKRAGCELIYKPIKPAHLRALISHLMQATRADEPQPASEQLQHEDRPEL